jgi:GT2 family glycosyltransferase
VKLIANSSNRGFAAAVNQGFSELNCAYILLLNPDAVLETSLDAMREACDLPCSAGSGGLLLDAKGTPQIGFMVRGRTSATALILEVLLLNRLWPNNQVNRRYRCLALDYCTRSKVEQPAGAFLMVRRNVWQELDGFDEGFFPLWFEDVDFCRRAIKRGFSLYYVPQVVAKHTGAHSIEGLSVEMRRFYWYRSLLRYSARHFRPLGFRAVALAVVAGSFLRMTVESAFQRSLRPVASYAKVVRFACRCCFLGWREEALSTGPPNIG